MILLAIMEEETMAQQDDRAREVPMGDLGPTLNAQANFFIL
jgi:hypothetical protein